MSSLPELISSLPLADEAEVVVAGGGPAGLCAAVSAAQEGAEVLLLERFGCLGGLATMGLINPWMPFFTRGKTINAGLFAEINARLHAETGEARVGEGADYAFDEEMLKQVAQEMALEAGVRLRLNSLLTGVATQGGQVTRLGVASKSGLQVIGGQVFVDATGDGDLCAWAGAEFEQGRPEDGLCQPMTLCFRMAGVDEERMPTRPEINALYDQARERGEIENPRENVLWFRTVHPGVVHFNTTRIVGKQGTSAEDLTAAEVQARQQVKETVAFLREYVAGFDQSFVIQTATMLGVRESRRVLGDYLLTVEDVLEARDFEDGIARGCYTVDIHSPTGAGTDIRHLRPGESYALPYRCLTPRGFENLLVTGRPISADHGAHSSLRIMPIAMNLGEAAGVAAARALKHSGRTRAVDVEQLRETLRGRGAVIEAP